ncbi:ABC transporter permease [Aquipuribacter sp. SD81]|uniref:ABC transporter permease n=1 Tax=Aquipuribacter sp. SD81 TaxID=3127703 RepID=UPI00301B1D51
MTDHGRRATVPWTLAVPGALAVALLVLPLLALVVRTPWSRLGEVVTDPQVRQALGLSLGTATVSTLLCLLLGVPLAWLLARTSLPGRRVVRALVTVPLVLPPVVGGVALLLLLGRNGLLGRPLDVWLGVTVPFSTAAVVLAQTFVALPFLVVSVEGALRTLDGRLEDAAATLGASRAFTFRHVTLPLVVPGLAAGAVLCFARALGEFGATITFAGSLPGTTRTTPVAVYLFLETDPDAAVVLSLVLLAVSVTVLLLLRERWWAVGR